MPAPDAVIDSLPRTAKRRTIVEDEVPAPPIPSQTVIPGMEDPEKSPEGWPGGAKDAFDYLQSLSPEGWNDHEIYLYWTGPAERKFNQLTKISEAITREWVQKNYGGSAGGFFTIWVNYIVKPKWHKTTQFNIEGDRIFVGQVVRPGDRSAGNGESGNLVALLEKMLDRLNRMDPNAQQAIDMVTSGYKTSLQAIAQGAGAPPANSGMDKITEVLITAFVGLLPQLLKPADPTASLEKAIGLLKEAGAFQATNPLTTIKTMGEAIVALKGIAGEGGEGGDDFKTTIAKGLVQAFPTIKEITSNMARVAEFNFHAGTATPMPPAAPGSAAPPPPPAPAASQPNPATPPAQPPAPATMEQFLWNRVAYMIDSDAEGDQIAQFLHFSTSMPSETKPGEVQSLCANFANMTPDQLLQILETIEPVQQALKGKDAKHLAEQFLYFCKTGDLCDDDEDDLPPSSPLPN